MDINLHWNRFIETGNEDSFSVIYEHYVGILYSYGRHLGFEDEACKDGIQDIFYKLYISRKKLLYVENPTAYLLRVLRNRLIDLIRKDNTTDILEHIETAFSIDVTVLDDIIDTETADMLKAKVENLLNSLSDQQREAVYMRYMLELDYDEIGRLLDIKPESVRKLVYRAMEKLRGQSMYTLILFATMI